MPSYHYANSSTTQPKTATACPPSTSTTWNRSSPSWKPPANSTPGDHASLGRRPQIRWRSLPAPPDPGRDRSLSEHPGRHAPGPRPIAGDLHGRHPFRFLVRDDGRLARKPTASRSPPSTTTSPRRKRWSSSRTPSAFPLKPNSACSARSETMKGDKEDGHGAEGHDDARDSSDRRRAGRRLRQEDAVRRAGHRHRHQPRRLQSSPKKPTGDILAIDRIKRNPRAHPELPPGHARSSSVPQELLAEIREFGGDMKETYGVPVEEIVTASSTACARSISTPTSAWR